MNTNDNKKAITPGVFLLRFIGAYIAAGFLISIITYPLTKTSDIISSNISLDPTNGGIIMCGVAVGILIYLILLAIVTSIVTVELSLINAKVEKDKAEKCKSYMKTFLSVLAFFSIIIVIGILFIVLLPAITRLINTPSDSNNIITGLIIPVSVICLSIIVYWVVLIKQCRKRFNKKVYGDGTSKPQTTGEQQVSQQQTNTNQNMVNTTVTNTQQTTPVVDPTPQVNNQPVTEINQTPTPVVEQTPVVEPTPVVNNEPVAENNQTPTTVQEMTMEQMYPQEINNTNNNQTN